MKHFDWPRSEATFRRLIARELHGVGELEQLLLERSELDAHLYEVCARTHDRSSCDTSNADAKRAYEEFFAEVQPQVEALGFELDRKIVESPYASELEPAHYAVLLRDLRAAVELFAAENPALEARDDLLIAQYRECIGALEVELDGEMLTSAQAYAKLEVNDRDVRERAWRGVSERRLAQAEHIDGLFSEQVELRDRMGRNSGCCGFTEYMFKRKRRFDYTPADCAAFHAGVEEHFMPLQKKLWEQRRAQLGLETLRPWDERVSVGGEEPLVPFESDDELIGGVARGLQRLDPELGALFESLRDGKSLDLGSRVGKAPGGYQNSYPESGQVFILMNTARLQRDVETLQHEAGHAFHALLAREQPLQAYREAGDEFSEVASMSMELLSHPYLDEFYRDEVDAERARRVHLEGIVRLFPWIAQGDAFQHWVYDHPVATADERAAAWSRLDERFRPGIDWRGLARERGREWHRVMHFFSVPYYYIEYGIAQLGALGVWQRSLTDRDDALARYKAALRLGGSRPLPELFAAAGVEFDIGPDALGRAADLLAETLDL